VVQNQPTSPGASDTPWSTPASTSASPVVSPSPMTREVASGGQPIAFPGDADPGGRDPVSSSVAGSVANGQARYYELQSDTYGQGSRIGDLLDLPDVPCAYSKHTGPPPADGGAYPA